MHQLYKLGEDDKPAGKYEEVGPRGGKIKDGNHATIDQGDRLPPTKHKINKWKKR
ncbi:YjzC family protein [Alkalibacterium sp. 20]|uniref:YjzC family protein n=1 Tax=Alkalibacterium sp. 20 TaxID=1798803 RepID=UPI0008FFE323|nr:YjzC family protein [Alkalibacterium sp. 20]